MVLLHQIEIFTRWWLAQLHAKTADCCFDQSHHVIMIYGRQEI